jgi:hypothetical protein
MEATKRCPFCAEEILGDAIRCKHCQADLGRREAQGPHIAIGVILLAVPAVAAVVEWNLVRGESLLQQPDRMVAAVCSATVLATAVLAAIEASMLGFGAADTPAGQIRRESPPLVWFAGLLLLWPISFPWFFSARKRFGQQGRVGVAVLVVALFVATGVVLLSQIESAKAEVGDALTRLGSDLAGPAQGALPKPSTPRPRPTWQETRRPSPMDDVPSIVVSRESDEAIMGSDGQDLFAEIVISCIKGKTGAYVDAKMLLNGQVRTWDDGYSWGSAIRSPVRARLDTDKATSGWWLISDDRESVFPSRPVDFIKGLMKHRQLRVELESSQMGSQSIPFSLDGLDESIKGLRSTCKW